MKLHSHKTVKIDQVKKMFVGTKKERKLKRDTKFVTYKRGGPPKTTAEKDWSGVFFALVFSW